MKLFRTTSGGVVFNGNRYYALPDRWDDLVNRDHLLNYLESVLPHLPEKKASLVEQELLAPIENQEVWGAGVTYIRSREARMEESESSGASRFYDLVYTAERPELFFKATAQRVVGHGGIVNIRRDSAWNVPEPELTLLINRRGDIQGYTIGNDMSSRSIEGENPLYLPQAKTFERCAALGPCVYIPKDPLPPTTTISLEILREGQVVFSDAVPISRMKRSPTELASFLFRECEFPFGCFLMTGTCLVPPSGFTLRVNDQVLIRIEGIGLLANTVGQKSSAPMTP
jgi:2-dehydro-3-deoxy-D-arabinonate dehydratase